MPGRNLRTDFYSKVNTQAISLRTQAYFRLSLVSAETSDSRKYVCVRRLTGHSIRDYYIDYAIGHNFNTDQGLTRV